MDIAEVRELLQAYGFAHLEAQLRPLRSLRLVPGGRGAGRSRLGGAPCAPTGFAWPRSGIEPMAFLGQLSLAEVRAVLPESPLSDAGWLLFFYEQDATVHGDEPEDGARGRVLLVEEAGGLAPVAAPAGLERSHPEYSLALVPEWTLPDHVSAQVERLGLDERERRRYFDLCDALAIRQAPVDAALTGEAPQHRLLGYPALVQDEPDGADEWRLLLQLDSDLDLEMLWGDAGRLYFLLHADAQPDGLERSTRAVLQST
jgi:uncharacterized protein YwqG